MEKWAVGALEKWRGYPPRKFGEYSNSHDDERDYIEQNLMTWAKRNKDDKLKLDILEKKMRYARDVIELSEEYHRQGMHGKIIPLLKMAHNVFEHDREITDLLSKALMELGDDSQAVKLAWDVFSKEPFSDTALDRLQVVSGKSKCWKEYYQKVLDFLQKQEEKENKSNSLSFFHGSMRERRVQVLFKHGDQQAAWELAQGAKLSERCWLTLAAWRSETLPQEAASVLDKLLTDALRPTGEDAYRHVIDLLMIYRKYLQMANREKDFAAYCTMLRTEYKRRRLLLEQMNIAKL